MTFICIVALVFNLAQKENLLATVLMGGVGEVCMHDFLLEFHTEFQPNPLELIFENCYRKGVTVYSRTWL